MQRQLIMHINNCISQVTCAWHSVSITNPHRYDYLAWLTFGMATVRFRYSSQRTDYLLISLAEQQHLASNQSRIQLSTRFRRPRRTCFSDLATPHIPILMLNVLTDPWPHMFQAVNVGEQIGIFALDARRLGAVYQVL